MKTRWVLMGAISVGLALLAANAFGQGDWTYDRGVYLRSGWANGYAQSHGRGYPFTTENYPPAKCFCLTDSNEVAGRLNFIFYLVAVWLIVFVGHLASKRLLPKAR